MRADDFESCIPLKSSMLRFPESPNPTRKQIRITLFMGNV